MSDNHATVMLDGLPMDLTVSKGVLDALLEVLEIKEDRTERKITIEFEGFPMQFQVTEEVLQALHIPQIVLSGRIGCDDHYLLKPSNWMLLPMRGAR